MFPKVTLHYVLKLEADGTVVHDTRAEGTSFAYSPAVYSFHTRRDRVAPLPPCRLYGAAIQRAHHSGQAEPRPCLVAGITQAVAEFPIGHPFHGIVYGSPEHDICSAPSFFFSPNVWFVRGLTSLQQLHVERPILTHNKTLEARPEQNPRPVLYGAHS